MTGIEMKKKKVASADIPQDENRIRRGKGDEVAITVRLPKADWMTLKQFAMLEGESLQTIAVNGFNRELIAKGHPPLSGDAAKP
jgi:hypothetical protein